MTAMSSSSCGGTPSLAQPPRALPKRFAAPPSRLLAQRRRACEAATSALLFEATCLRPCAAQEGSSNSSSGSSSWEVEERAPDAFHWVLAVVLGAVLIGGLLRVFRVLQKGDNVTPVRQAPEGMRPVECGACRAMQYVSTHGRIFICFCCHSANRIPTEAPRSEQQSVLIVPTGPLRRFEFKRSGENYFEEMKREEIEDGNPSQAPAQTATAEAPSQTPVVAVDPAANAAAPAEATSDPESQTAEARSKPRIIGRQSTDKSGDSENSEVLPQCVVCLDVPGNMVLLPCAHGSVCEECATRIVQNGASGGVHCPHCRSNIETLVKIDEVEGDLAKGIEYRIPMARVL